MIDARMPRLLEPMRRHDERENDWAIVRKKQFRKRVRLEQTHGDKTRKNIPFRGPGAATYPGPEDHFLIMAASRAEFRFFELPLTTLTFRRRGDKVSLCNVPHTWCSPPSACAKVFHRKDFLASLISACSQHRHDVWSPSASWACAKHWRK